MKTKSIIFSGLLLLSLGAATTSCEDMLNVDDELHTKNLAPQDTVYQVMGIINRMQSLVDRTVVLGELRADLVDLNTSVAKTSLQDVMNNNISTSNEYNSIADYYAVINSCNVYLSNVDSTFVSHNKLMYEKEVQAVKVFRAWTYLELAKTYGSVPFVTEPVLSSATADKIIASTTNRANMNDICSYFIDDLLPYASKNIANPNYGSINNFASTNFFIPSRLMLAELYLWRGSYTQNKSDFVQACKYYHDYFCDKELTPGTNSVNWTGTQFDRLTDGYSSGISNDAISIIPMDTCAYDGTWSELYGFFNSQFENNYYVPVIPSQRIREISRDQINCLYSSINNSRDTLYSTQKLEWEDSLEMGDLRLSAIYDRSAVSNMYTKVYSQDRQHIMKYATSTSNYGADQKLKQYTIFRKNIVWLHFAEALNRAGFPETAFVVLKYGITPENIQHYVSAAEQAELANVATYFRGNLGAWDENVFITKHSSNFTTVSRATTQGLHSRGSGDSEYNAYYVLPYYADKWIDVNRYQVAYDSLSSVYNIDVASREKTLVGKDDEGNNVYKYTYTSEDDSIYFVTLVKELSETGTALKAAKVTAYEASQPGYMSAVGQMILDEEALEGTFEGSRFYDLMRYAMYNGDKDYIANQVAKRKGSSITDDRSNNLKGGNWYLPLPNK